MLEGPQTDGVTIGDKGECVITPSTDLKFDPGLKGKSKLNYLRNYWLLIGERRPRAAPCWAMLALLIAVNALCLAGVLVDLSDLEHFYSQGK